MNNPSFLRFQGEYIDPDGESNALHKTSFIQTVVYPSKPIDILFYLDASKTP